MLNCLYNRDMAVRADSVVLCLGDYKVLYVCQSTQWYGKLAPTIHCCDHEGVVSMKQSPLG
jgi:hypothetical protein